MDFAKALRIAAEKAGWNATTLGAETGVTETAARRWLNGESEPRRAQYQALRDKLPLFADLVDGKAAVA